MYQTIFFASLFASAWAAPLSRRGAHFSSNVSVELDGLTYVNKGLCGFGIIPHNFRESSGDTIGGFGGAAAIKLGTWRTVGNGSFEGTFVLSPDRGYNVEQTIDYQARQHEVDFILAPYYDSERLSFEDAKKTLQLSYVDTFFQFDTDGVTPTTGLDSLAVRPAKEAQFPANPFAQPEFPIAREDYPRTSIDAEGLVVTADGSYWISDEYGPYIYRFSADGRLLQAIQPPNAILPRDADGNLNFTSGTNPATGRQGNQGFENLSLDTEAGILYAMLQSATMQDGGKTKSTSSNTRLLAYNISNDASAVPELVGEWVVPLPRSNSKGNTRASSEIAFVSLGIFLALSRDGDGRGGDETESKYKQIDLFSIADATDIHGTEYDDPAHPVAPGGKLVKSVTPATYVSFVDFLNDDQLARFGLHNDDPNDETLISAKWEGLALAPIDDAAFPDDLFTFADNDFMSTEGISLGKPFDAGIDVDNQFLVFRITLPGVGQDQIRRALGV